MQRTPRHKTSLHDRRSTIYYLGQPTRSGYSYDYDDPDEAEKPSAGSDLLMVLLAIVVSFLLPYLLLVGVIVYLLYQALGRIKSWIKSKTHNE